MSLTADQHLRYRMPAEWAPHAATWIAWPHNPEDWPGKFQPIPWVYCEIVRWLSSAEDVHILVNDLAAEKRATQMLRRQGANLARLHFHAWRTDRVWLRDSGPIFVKQLGVEQQTPLEALPTLAIIRIPPSTATGTTTT